MKNKEKSLQSRLIQYLIAAQAVLLIVSVAGAFCWGANGYFWTLGAGELLLLVWGMMFVIMYRQHARLLSSAESHIGETAEQETEETIQANRSAQGEILPEMALYMMDKSEFFIAYLAGNCDIRYLNQGAADIIGYSKEEVMEQGFGLFIGEDDLCRYKEEAEKALVDSGRYSCELSVRRKDGEIRRMLFNSFLVDNFGDGMAVFAVDISTLREMEGSLLYAKKQAESANKAKGEFLSRMSHEMRTPMNAIIGMTGIARDSRENEKMLYCLDKIDIASKHLLAVINDVLDMSKIEANKLELSNSDFVFEKMLIDSMNVVEVRAAEKKQDLSVSYGTDIPYSLVGDRMRLVQVISNLISNAVKFTPERGSISLSVKKISGQSGDILLRFDITDTGIGISKEQRKHLFRSFEQADGGIARQYGGTGLGLAISKSIVEMMGGEIGVESEPDKGSNFFFTCRLRKGAISAPDNMMPHISRDKLNVLVVDDSDELREYFLSIMESLHIRCLAAGDAEECLDLIDRQTEPFSIIFVDWQMPGMNGIDLTRLIKQSSKDEVVIIMISVAEWSEIEQDAIAAGVDMFMPKPLFPSMLVNAINQCLRKNIPVATRTRYIHRVEPRSIKASVLLAEDIEVNREIIAAILTESGISLSFAANGREALEMFKSAPECDLILMDIHMPEMSGVEATRAIRSLGTEHAKNVPIVAMTADVFREDVEQYINAGMNGHIGKPIIPEELFAKLEEFLPLPELPEQPALEPELSGDYAKYLPCISVESGLSKLLNNKQVYLKLLTDFAGEKIVQELRKKAAQEDFSSVQQIARNLKGAAANLGLLLLEKAAEELEQDARDALVRTKVLSRLERHAEETAATINSLIKDGL